MAEQTIELPTWIEGIVEQCKDSGNFAPLIDKFSSSRIAYDLDQAQREYLYKLAESALVQRAQRWWLVRSGHFEAANRLYHFVLAAKSHVNLDLEQHFVSTPELEWQMIQYARSVRELQEAYKRAKEESWRRGKVLLAKNLLASDPVDLWLYADDGEVLFNLAREGYLDEIQTHIERCRSGNGGIESARNVLRAVQVLHYKWSDLGITRNEVEQWARQRLITDISSKLHFGLNGSNDLLYANIHGPLKLMLQHGISLEELGTTKEQLTEAKRRLERWVQQVTSGCRGPEYQAERRNFRKFLETVLPLFDQVLQD